MKLSKAGLVVIVALALGIGAAPFGADAQQAGKVPRVGLLLGGVPGTPSTISAALEAFRQGLRDLGYVEGRSIEIEYRWAKGRIERLPDLAAELVRLKVDVIVAPATPQAVAARNATKTIPIVMATSVYPVVTGVVASVERPGGNVTGLTLTSLGIIGKRLELLKEVVPGVSRVAAVHPGLAGFPTIDLWLRDNKVAAQTVGLKLQTVDVGGDPDEWDRALAAVARDRTGALTLIEAPLFLSEQTRLVDLMAKHRLPAIYPFQDFTDAGGLMSYGANLADLYRRAATYVDRILKGAKPGELPVEEPARFELCINLKTAKGLGLTIPPSLLARADRVIE
ncbi:MAG: ABC transporter substrate-binding protein [Candidatus Rokubacteria bacterium]|nr:ABC transporter substrate-binding protein [Candidatus Rokubacteria bacterium]